LVTRSSKKIRKQVTQQQPCHYFQRIEKLNKKSLLSLLIVIFSLLLTGCEGPDNTEVKSKEKILFEQRVKMKIERAKIIKLRAQKRKAIALKHKQNRLEILERRQMQMLIQKQKRQQHINKRKLMQEERKRKRQEKR
jgi:uncharacterized lipoprotein YajG